jgi:hypothetical protein
MDINGNISPPAKLIHYIQSTSKVLFLPGEGTMELHRHISAFTQSNNIIVNLLICLFCTDLKAGIRNVLVLLRGRAETAREGSLYITNYR